MLSNRQDFVHAVRGTTLQRVAELSMVLKKAALPFGSSGDTRSEMTWCLSAVTYTSMFIWGKTHKIS